MLVGSEDKNLIFLNRPARVHRIVVQIDARVDLVGCKQNGPRAPPRRPADEIKFAMKLVAAGIGDGVVNVARGAAEFRSEAVRYRLHFAHVAIGNREQAQAVLIAFRRHHSVHLILHAVIEAIGVHHARDAQFRIGVSAHAGLEQNKIIGIARGQRQIVDLHGADGPAGRYARRLDHRRSPGNLHGGGHGADLQLRVDHTLGSCVEDHVGVALRLESFLRHGNRVVA